MIDPPSTARLRPARPRRRPVQSRTRPHRLPLLGAVLLAMLVALLSPDPASAEERTFFYTYDGLGRLVSATDGISQIDYAYDAGGNLLSRTVPEPGLGSGLVGGVLALAALGSRRRRRHDRSLAPRCSIYGRRRIHRTSPLGEEDVARAARASSVPVGRPAPGPGAVGLAAILAVALLALPASAHVDDFSDPQEKLTVNGEMGMTASDSNEALADVPGGIRKISLSAGSSQGRDFQAETEVKDGVFTFTFVVPPNTPDSGSAFSSASIRYDDTGFDASGSDTFTLKVDIQGDEPPSPLTGILFVNSPTQAGQVTFTLDDPALLLGPTLVAIPLEWVPGVPDLGNITTILVRLNASVDVPEGATYTVRIDDYGFNTPPSEASETAAERYADSGGSAAMKSTPAVGAVLGSGGAGLGEAGVPTIGPSPPLPNDSVGEGGRVPSAFDVIATVSESDNFFPFFPDPIVAKLVVAPEPGQILPNVAPQSTNSAPGVADPVVATTGESLLRDVVDLEAHGPLDLRFVRSYARFQGFAAQRGGFHTALDGPLGAHWSHSFHRLLRRVSATEVTVLHRKGALLEFTKPGTTWQLEPTGYRGTPYQLVENGTKVELMDPVTRLIFVYEFANTPDGTIAPVESIRDRNGNTITLSYNPDDTLAQASNGIGATLTFAYTSSGGVQRISQVTDQANRTTSYAYDGSNLVSVTNRRNLVTQYAYDTNSAITSVTRPRGNVVVQHSYLADGRAVTQTDGEGNLYSLLYLPGETLLTDPTGEVRSFVHDADLRITDFTDEAGNVVTHSHDAEGRRIGTVDRLLESQGVTYHAPSGYAASRTDTEGSTWSYTWTAQTQDGFTFYVLTRVDLPNGSAFTYDYDPAGNLTLFTDEEGNETGFTHDARGLVLTVTNAAGGVTTHTYNADGTRATTEDPAGNLTSFGHDASNRLTSIARPGATSTDFTYDDNDNLLTVTNDNSLTSTFIYDDNDNVASFTDPDGDVTSFAYDGNDNPIEVIDPAGENILVGRDGLQRVESITDAMGNSTDFVFDARRRLTAIVDAKGNLQINYDDEAIPTALIDPDGDMTLLTSNSLGDLTEVEDAQGNRATFEYDTLRRLSRTVDPLGQVTDFVRNLVGDVTQIDLPLTGHSATYTRNVLRQVESYTDLNGETWQRVHDSQGRLVQRVDPLGNLESRTYDSRNRVDTIGLPGGLGSVELTYDAGDRLVGTSYPDGSLFSFNYTDDNFFQSANGIELVRNNRGLVTRSNGLEVTWDPSRNLTTITFDDASTPAKTVTYGYDARDMVTSVTDWAGGVTMLTRDADGKVERIDHANGTGTEFEYDTSDRLIRITDSTTGGGATLSDISLTRDANGQITQATRDLPLQAASTSTGVTQTFDAASQNQSASYDVLGRVQDDGRTYVWNQADQLLEYVEGSETIGFTRDASGNVLTRTQQGETRSYVWNYAFFGLPSIATELLNGVPLRHYVYTPEGRLLYSIDDADDARHVYHFDEVGNTMFITNDAGQIERSYSYSPYGELLAETGSLENLFTFHGKYGVRREGGLYDMRARYYDPIAASFISRDPIVQLDPRNLTPYQALLQNPLCYYDALGTRPMPIGVDDGSTARGCASGFDVPGELFVPVVGPVLRGTGLIAGPIESFGPILAGFFRRGFVAAEIRARGGNPSSALDVAAFLLGDCDPEGVCTRPRRSSGGGMQRCAECDRFVERPVFGFNAPPTPSQSSQPTSNNATNNDPEQTHDKPNGVDEVTL